MNRHPIAFIFQMCRYEKAKPKSQLLLNQINGNFIFDDDEINMISLQLNNHLLLSKILPENRFSVKFNENSLRQILENNQSSNNCLFILLSGVAWLINFEATHHIDNLDLVLDLLNSLPDSIIVPQTSNNHLPLYEITRFFYESIINENIDFPFQNIESQTRRFINKYKDIYKYEIIKDTLLQWLQKGYSIESPTIFTKSLLSFTGVYFEENSELFSPTILENLTDILQREISVFETTVLCFLIQIADKFPEAILFKTVQLLLNSVLPFYASTNTIQYKLFDLNEYSNSKMNFVYDEEPITSYSLQFPNLKPDYNSELHLFPQIQIDHDFKISSFILKISKYILKFISNGSVNMNEYTIFFQKILEDTLTIDEYKPFFLDIIATLISIIQFSDQEYDTFPLLQILLNSSFYTESLTVFTPNSEKEALHNIRMLSYFFLVLQNKSTMQLFFKEKMKYPLLISELFYYISNTTNLSIAKNILQSESFEHIIFTLLLTYHSFPKSKSIHQTIAQQSKSEEIEHNDSDSLEIKHADEGISLPDEKDVFDSEYDENLFKASTSFSPSKPLNVPNEFAPDIPNHSQSFSVLANIQQSSSQINDLITTPKDISKPLSLTEKDHSYDSRLRLVFSESMNFLQAPDEIAENDSKSILSQCEEEEGDEGQLVSCDQIIKEEVINPNIDNDASQKVNPPQSSPQNNEPSTIFITKIKHKKRIEDLDNNFLQYFNLINENINKEKDHSMEITIDDSLHVGLAYILMFIKKTIESDMNIAAKWNESMELIPALFALLFDEYLRPIIISIILKMWYSKPTSVPLISQDCILAIFRQNYDEDFALLDLQLLETINMYLQTTCSKVSIDKCDTRLCDIFGTFLPISPLISTFLTNCDVSIEFVDNSMQFFSYYPYSIKRLTRSAISLSLLRIEGLEISRRFYNRYISIITSFKNFNQSTGYLITQPKMVSVFLESFFESDMLKDVVIYIESLSEHSYHNLLSLHKGKVDETLIKFVLKYKEHELIPDILKLFSKIALRASSMPVVSNFISLFSPLNSKYIAPYTMEAIQTLTNINKIRFLQPMAYLPLSKNSPYVNITKLSAYMINQGFTFNIKLSIDNFAQNFPITLLTISDKRQTLRLAIENRQVRIYNNLMQLPISFQNQIPINILTTIAVTFCPLKKIVQCQISNKSNLSTVKYDFIEFGTNNSLIAFIGNGENGAPSISEAAMISNFDFHLISPSINDVEDNSPLFDLQKSHELNPILSVEFRTDQSQLCLHKINSQMDVDAILDGGNLITYLAFPDILINFFKPDILIPLFAQIGLPVFSSHNENAFQSNFTQNYVKSVLNLLSSTLQLSLETQESFSQSKGFKIIAYILKQHAISDILTFDLYLHFVLLFDQISENELKKQIFVNIISNSEIWSLALPRIYQQIIYVWDKQLLQTEKDIFLELLPLFKLIQTVSLFYISKPDQNQSDDDTRKLIKQLLFDVSQAKFSENDFKGLFMTCLASQNIELRIDLLGLIRDLAELKEKSPLLNEFWNSSQFFFTLNILLPYKDEEIVLSAIKTIVTLHKANIIKNITLTEHLEMIMMSFKRNSFTDLLIHKLVELSCIMPETLPISCYIAMLSISNKDLVLDSLRKSLHPNDSYSTNKFWFIWPLQVAIKNESILDFMLHFIILSTLKDWIDIFISIYIVSTAFNIDPWPIMRRFLLILAKLFLSNEVHNDISTFFDICTIFIIAKPFDKESKALTHAYNESVFNRVESNNVYQIYRIIEDHQQINVKPDQSSPIDSSSVNDVLIDRKNENDPFDSFVTQLTKIPSSSSSEFKFMLDLNKNGDWLDLELSQLVIELFYTKNSADIIEFKTFVNALKKPECDKLYEVYESVTIKLQNIFSRVKSISSFILKNRQKVLDFNDSIQTPLENICENSFIYISKLQQRSIVNHHISKKLWYNLWRTLTDDRSPLRNSLPFSETHFKRNNRIYAYFCPVKLKRNLNFNDHKEASFNRDWGSSVVAKQHYTEYQQEMKEKKEKEAPSALLKVENVDNMTEMLLSSYNDSNINYFGIESINFDLDDADKEFQYYFNPCNKSTSVSLQNQQQIQVDLLFQSKRMQKYPASLITVFGHKNIIFCILPTRFRIVYLLSQEQINLNETEINGKIQKVKTIDASSVTHILFRSYLHQEKGFEIVTKDGKTYFVNLINAASLDVLKMISMLPNFQHALIQTVPHLEFTKRIRIQTKWKQGLVSNFEYLMQLNFLGGRTFNETTMYPVFPWIIKDYNSPTIDLNDPSIYRDLSIPIGAQTEKRLQELKSHIQDYITIRNVGFLYNTCYISPLCVYLWLIRLEPFTTLHIQLQSGKFDYAARTFFSIPLVYNMVTTHLNDYRELIPEFFYTSSFLENRNHFDLGSIHNKEINDVTLPKWSKSAIDFVYVHRKALESDYVNQHLNGWIDLIFGEKQKGPKAVEANNTFDPCLYENVWTKENITDPTQKAMIEAILQHCGHIPNQLFTEPHPKKDRFEFEPISKSTIFQAYDNFSRSLFVKFIDEHSPFRVLMEKTSSIKTQCMFLSNDGSLSYANLKTNLATGQTMCKIFPYPSKTAYKSIKIDLSLANTGKMENMSFNAKNGLLVIPTNVGAIKIVQITDQMIKKEIVLVKHVGRVNCVYISNNYIVSGGSDTTINIWSSKIKVDLSTVPSDSLSPRQSKPNHVLMRSNSSVSKTHRNSINEKMKPWQPKKPTMSQSSSITNFALLSNRHSVSDVNNLSMTNSPICHLKTIQSFKNEITCIDVSEKFGTIACGTKDGSIILIDIAKLEPMVTINISPEIPNMIKITSCWGFVLVYSNKEHEGHIKSYLSVFDIDGQFIRKKSINFLISCWTHYSSLSGFDYFAVASMNSAVMRSNDENGNQTDRTSNLYLFEAFYLDVEDAGIARNSSKIVDLKYSIEKGMLYAARENGSICMYSVKDLNTQRFNRTVFGEGIDY